MRWPVRRQSPVENQSQTKRVESCLVRCLDGGSSPPISTDKKKLSRNGWAFLFVEIYLNPCQLRCQPLLGAYLLPLRSSRASPVLQLFIKSLADADGAALMRLSDTSAGTLFTTAPPPQEKIVAGTKKQQDGKRSRIHLTHFSMRSTRFPAHNPGPQSAPPDSRRSQSSPTSLSLRSTSSEPSDIQSDDLPQKSWI